MFLARIEGTVTSTVKHPTLAGLRLLIGQRIEADGSPTGDPLILVDTFGARQGATVLVTTENEPLRNRVGNTTPARLLVAGLIDEVFQEPPSSPSAVGQAIRLPIPPAGAKEHP